MEICRFAPSPTGLLHVGNARTALVNFLYAKQRQGGLILRIDDTDLQRCKLSFLKSILEDLRWIGISWDEACCQSSREKEYTRVAQTLIEQGSVYACYETPQELEQKRNSLLQSGRPPIYDRCALQLSEAQKRQYEKEGRSPYYRFLLKDQTTTWHDLIRGKVSFRAKDLSDPVVIRENGSATYLLSSVIDDLDHKVTTILRGEDHLTNTAMQCQMFGTLSSFVPSFGHLSLLQTSQTKISKRVGGFSLQELKKDIHPAALRSFLALIGSSKELRVILSLEGLLEEFDISALSKSHTSYDASQLRELNAKCLMNLDYDSAKACMQTTCHVEAEEEPYQEDLAVKLLTVEESKAEPKETLSKEAWYKIRSNLEGISEIEQWCKILSNNHPKLAKSAELSYLQEAAELFPEELSEESYRKWIQKLSGKTGRKGPDLYMPIRLALTGMEHGPQLYSLLSILGRDEVLKRLT